MNTLKVAEEIVVTLTEEALPQWKRRQQMACIGASVDTSLDRLQKWWELGSVSCRGGSFVCGGKLFILMLFVQVHGCRRSATGSAWTAAETARPEQEILHRCLRPRWSHGGNWEFCSVLVHKTYFKVRHLIIELYSMEADAHVHIVETFCCVFVGSALVVEKQPVMTLWPQRPLLLKTTVRFAVSVRWGSTVLPFMWLVLNRRAKPQCYCKFDLLLRFLANLPKFKWHLNVKPAFDK